MLNSVVKISIISAKYFEYYTIILRGRFFVDTLYFHPSKNSFMSLYDAADVTVNNVTHNQNLEK